MTAFSESTSCGVPYVGTPIMSRSGSLGDSERILGPVGRLFGRTVGEVRSSLVPWTVPMSGGRTAMVHPAALPAFQQVTAGLNQAAAEGHWYPIASAYAFTPRTIGGVAQLSRHALGLSIDINPASNPYSEDPHRLISDLPEWFIQVWRDAGFCWGGDWVYSKDPMHFAWMGPDPGSGGLPLLDPFGTEVPYFPAATLTTGWADAPGQGSLHLADLSGFGATDVVRLRPHIAGTVVEVLMGRSGYERCSLYRWMLEGVGPDSTVVFGDVDGDSRADAVAIAPDGTLRVFTRQSEFSEVLAVPTGRDVAVAAIADADGDRQGDLHLVLAGGEVEVLGGPDLSTVVASYAVDRGLTHLAGGDRDGDGTVEMYAVVGDRVDIVGTAETVADVGAIVSFSAADMDGDFRSDLAFLRPTDTIDVWVGNSPTGRAITSWWVNPDFECPDEPLPLAWSGTFHDDDTSGFQWAVEEMAAGGVTNGCNPPYGDAFCPDDPVTRGQMAAFISRALGLVPAGGDTFADDGASGFEAEIEAIAAAGITLGCGAGRFCPDRVVTRGEMAAFVARALQLPVGDGDLFADDDGSPFEAEIEAIAAAGITEGCGPGAYCPDDPVLRKEMAAFLARMP